MKVLLVAYDFDPIASPQSLRWIYLSRELHRQGIEVTVLTTDRTAPGLGLPVLPEGVRVYRTFAGPLFGALGWLQARRHPVPSEGALPRPAITAKGVRRQLVDLARRAWAQIWFPDERGEWVLAGRSACRRVLAIEQPNVVIGSHEPAVSLILAMEAARQGIPWIADLGDPIDAPYTKTRWRARAASFEGEVARSASLIVVTSEATKALLVERHRLDADSVVVITQGYAPYSASESVNAGEDLTLLYSGRFYAFRDPSALLHAVDNTEGVRLDVMGELTPEDQARLEAIPKQKRRFLGNLPHESALGAQRRADVLVNIGNSPATQVPGKIYEYLGAGRPILQIQQDPDDAGSSLIRNLERGWVVENDPQAISAQLRQLVSRRREGRLDEGCRLDANSILAYSWEGLAAKYRAQIERVAGEVASEHRVHSPE